MVHEKRRGTAFATSVFLLLAVAAGTWACGGVVSPGGSGGSAEGAAVRCARGLTNCDGACVNLRTSAADCGSCGNACVAAEVCTRGACTGCPTGETGCSGTCVNLQTSAANCGSCGAACLAGETCSAGTCACPAGQTLCGTACANLQTSAANCGSCGAACLAGETCSAGTCACPAGQTLCGSACVSTASNPGNCGACGNACSTGTVCVAGACVTGLALGATTYKNDVAGRGTNPMTTPPVNTEPSGSTFVVFVGAGILGTDAFQSLTDNMGNSYTEIGVAQPYASNQGELRAYYCANCVGGTGHTFSLHKVSSLSNWEAVLFAVEVLGAPTLDTFAEANLSSLATGLAVDTSASGDMLLACVLAASYGSPDRYTPSAGFTLIDDQTNGSDSLGGADAWELAGGPGSYTGALPSSLAKSGAAFLVALAPPPAP